MVRDLLKYVEQNELFSKKDYILLAVSGGLDSMVMCDLFRRAGYNFGIIHCNFTLRAQESEEDEKFVRRKAEEMKVLFCTERFDTKKYASDKGISIQMAARELRYEYFLKVANEKGFDYIATAHHQDDQIETFLINLSRQSGIAGFHGILPKKERLVRPMLFCDRKRIAAYAKSRCIEYREDSSNKETKYLRNKVRHEIIPVLKNLNPEIISIINDNIQRIREAEIIFREHIEQERKQTVKKRKNEYLINIERLKDLSAKNTFAFEFLSPFGFNYPVVKEVVDSLDHESGITWYSSTHRLIKDRKNLIITNLPKDKTEQQYYVPQDMLKITSPLHLNFSIIRRDHEFEIDGSPAIANLDAGKLEFPLTIRKWEKGDIFHPYGSGHKKKLSDFFTDNKFSISDKENTWLLCSGNKIAWVIGHRIDHRFRITSATKEVYRIRCK